jgi:hypothetical protein
MPHKAAKGKTVFMRIEWALRCFFFFLEELIGFTWRISFFVRIENNNNIFGR